MSQLCIVRTCPHQYKRKTRTCGFHKFPDEMDDDFDSWLEAVSLSKECFHRTPRSKRFVCTCHFPEQAFEVYFERKVLKTHVAPSLFLPEKLINAANHVPLILRRTGAKPSILAMALTIPSPTVPAKQRRKQQFTREDIPCITDDSPEFDEFQERDSEEGGRQLELRLSAAGPTNNRRKQQLVLRNNHCTSDDDSRDKPDQSWNNRRKQRLVIRKTLCMSDDKTRDSQDHGHVQLRKLLAAPIRSGVSSILTSGQPAVRTLQFQEVATMIEVQLPPSPEMNAKEWISDCDYEGLKPKEKVKRLEKEAALLRKQIVALKSGIHAIFGEYDVHILLQCQSENCWTEAIIEKAQDIRYGVGLDGYNMLRAMHMPLPNERVLPRRTIKNSSQQKLTLRRPK